MKNFLSKVFVSLTFLLCVNDSSAQISGQIAGQVSGQIFGQDLKSGEGQILEGVVVEVCQNKGCWMKVKKATDERMIRFKDYGFFVPKNLKGQRVKFRAVDVDKFLSVKEQKHLLEDAGASKDEIAKVTKAINRPEWLASGVEVIASPSSQK